MRRSTFFNSFFAWMVFAFCSQSLAAGIPNTRLKKAKPDPTHTQEPLFTIRSKQKLLSFTRTQLLSRADVKTITLEDDPAYPGLKISYLAIPLVHLFQSIDVPEEAII